MSDFSLSAVALGLLSQASLDPRRINRAIDGSLARGNYARLHSSNYYVRHVRQVTGVSLASIHRQRCHLQITIENRCPFWTYQEFSRAQCQLFWPAVFPETVDIAIVGRLFSELIGPHGLLGKYIVTAATKQVSSVTNQASATIFTLGVPWQSEKQRAKRGGD